MKAIVKAVKGTYDVKEDLKAEGFSWDKEEKVWVKEYSDIEEFESFKAKNLNATYNGRKGARLFSQVVFEVETIEETGTEETATEETVEVAADKMIETTKKTYTYQEIVDRFGKDVADKAISTGAEPTSRYIYPAFEPQHVGLKEWAEAPIEIDGYIIRAYYYLTEEDEQNLDFFDWEEKAEFEVEECLY